MTPGFSLVKEFIDNGYGCREALETRKTSDDLEEFVKKSPFMLTRGMGSRPCVERMDPEF